MKAQRLAPLAGVFLIAGGPVFAQCATEDTSENVAYVAKGGVGTICVTDHEQVDRLCIAAGKIAAYDYDVVAEKNMLGTTEVTQLDDRCIEAKTTGHAKEASRTPNGWLCMAAERTIAVHISYCP